MAPSRKATTSGSTLPAERKRSQLSHASTARAAIAPAASPPTRAARRKARTIAASPAVRTTTSHRLGAAVPNSASGAVNSTASGFQPVPEMVLRPRLGTTISRPNTTHAHGS